MATKVYVQAPRWIRHISQNALQVRIC